MARFDIDGSPHSQEHEQAASRGMASPPSGSPRKRRRSLALVEALAALTMEMEKMETDAAEAEGLRKESGVLAVEVAEKDARLAAAETQAKEAQARLEFREREMGYLVEKLATKCLAQEAELARSTAALEERDAEATGLRERIQRLEDDASVGEMLVQTLKTRHAEALDASDARWQDAVLTIEEKDAIIAARDELIQLLRAPEMRLYSRLYGPSFFAQA